MPVTVIASPGLKSRVIQGVYSRRFSGCTTPLMSSSAWPLDPARTSNGRLSSPPEARRLFSGPVKTPRATPFVHSSGTRTPLVMVSCSSVSLLK